MKNYLAISGSLREKSFNTSLLRAVKRLADGHINIEILDISQFPFYNEDVEKSNFPEIVTEIKNKISNADGIIFATPEYNRSISGVLKNVIDWISRPYGSKTCHGKKAIVLGASNGMLGTSVAQSHLKQILLVLGMDVMGQPEFYLSFAQEKFDTDGNLIDEKTKEKILKIIEILK